MPSIQHHRETLRQRLSIYNIYTTICQKTLDIGGQRYFSRYIDQLWAHSNISEAEQSNNLEDLGIVQLPVYSKRIKQTFPGLIIDEEGAIEVDDSDEEFSVTVVESPEKNVQKRKVIEALKRKRKVTEALEPNKKSKQNKTQLKNQTAFICDICKASLSRKNSLITHIKKMHS